MPEAPPSIFCGVVIIRWAKCLLGGQRVTAAPPIYPLVGARAWHRRRDRCNFVVRGWVACLAWYAGRLRRGTRALQPQLWETSPIAPTENTSHNTPRLIYVTCIMF
jgi:hypothetical protein